MPRSSTCITIIGPDGIRRWTHRRSIGELRRIRNEMPIAQCDHCGRQYRVRWDRRYTRPYYLWDTNDSNTWTRTVQACCRGHADALLVGYRECSGCSVIYMDTIANFDPDRTDGHCEYCHRTDDDADDEDIENLYDDEDTYPTPKPYPSRNHWIRGRSFFNHTNYAGSEWGQELKEMCPEAAEEYEHCRAYVLCDGGTIIEVWGTADNKLYHRVY